jgi:hypothetical protein
MGDSTDNSHLAAAPGARDYAALAADAERYWHELGAADNAISDAGGELSEADDPTPLAGAIRRLAAERDAACARSARATASVGALAAILGMEPHVPSLKVAAQALRDRAEKAERERDQTRAALGLLLNVLTVSANPVALRAAVDAGRAALAPEAPRG